MDAILVEILRKAGEAEVARRAQPEIVVLGEKQVLGVPAQPLLYCGSIEKAGANDIVEWQRGCVPKAHMPDGRSILLYLGIVTVRNVDVRMGGKKVHEQSNRLGT